MTLNDTTLQQLALHLDGCQQQARDTVKITDQHPDMDWEDAYEIQDRILKLHLDRGARVAGLKCGLTSRAKMTQMGVTEPVFGFLVDTFAVAPGEAVDTRALIHPKVEPEIVFVLKHELRGPGCHVGAVLAATDFVMAGIEVIDSRYRDFKFDLKSVIADNTSAARFVVGGRACPVDEVDLRTCGVVLEKNGQPVALGAGAAVLGHPAAAVAALANHLGRRGRSIAAGTMILCGGVTEAVAVAAGDHVQLRVQGMGAVGLRFV